MAQNQQYSPGGRIPAQLYPQAAAGNMRPPVYPQGYGQVKLAPRRLTLPGRWTPASLIFAICIIVLAVVAIIVSLEIIDESIEDAYHRYGEQARRPFENTTNIFKVAILALIPLVVIIALVRWIDRWEPEPILFYVLSLGWGAGVSVYGAFKGNEWWSKFVRDWVKDTLQHGGFDVSGAGSPRDASLAASGAASMTYKILSQAVGAGVVEEGVKGLGILLMFSFLKKYINGPIDGMIYGILIGAGFAFTENILYFAQADSYTSIEKQLGKYVTESPLDQSIVARAIATPFVHPICTAITGLLIGLAATQRLSALFVLPLGIAGYTIAAGLHASHNFSAIIGVAKDTSTRILIQIPVYVAAVAMISVVKNLQRTTVKRGIRLLVADGFIGKEDETMLMRSNLRSRAVAWAGERLAASGGVAQDGRKAMKRYQTELLQAGFFRALLADNEKSPDLSVIRRERERMTFILKLRGVFLPSTSTQPNQPTSSPNSVAAVSVPTHATPAHPQASPGGQPQRPMHQPHRQAQPQGQQVPSPQLVPRPEPSPRRRAVPPQQVPPAAPHGVQPLRQGPPSQSQQQGNPQNPRPQGLQNQGREGRGGYRSPSQQSGSDYPPSAPPPQRGSGHYRGGGRPS